ncbi:MAG TPA: glycosyltransferase family 4 protein [Acidimicrobiales bacterium]|nr:glycosyltransferase family 4 protein [Acidimicrobiales bacterium]
MPALTGRAADAAAAARLVELLVAGGAARLAPPPLRRRAPSPPPLRVALLGAPADAGAPGRASFDHARWLQAAGVKVEVLSHFAAPPSADGRVPFVRVPFGEPLEDAISPCDVVVACHWDQVAPARQLGIAPVVYLELGGFHLYDALPPQLEAMVRASIRCADDVVAVGDEAAAALDRRYGVATRTVALGLDDERFHPGAEEPAGHVVVLAGAGADADRLDDARAVVARLGAAHPNLAVVWAVSERLAASTPLPGVAVPLEGAAAPSLYRRAAAVLAPGDYQSLAIGVLEAMACGAPVVVTDTPGIRHVARDGSNCLLAPLGDVERLAASVARLLEDARLARRLGAGAARSARRSSSRRAAALLARHYRAVAAAQRFEAPAPVHADLGGATFTREGDKERFEVRLDALASRLLALPLSCPTVAGLRVVRWKVVATNEAGAPGVTRAYLPLRSELPLADSPYQAAIDLLAEGDGAGAFADLARRCEAAARPEQAVLGRWVVLALLASGRAGEAADLAAAFARDFPAHPDYLYLELVAARAARRPHDVLGTTEALRVLGNGARYEEWFEDPLSLLEAELR